MKASYILLFFALFFTISLWNMARSWWGGEKKHQKTLQFLFFQFVGGCRRHGRLTKPHRAPSSVATMVAARGVLYMRASSPKLPLLLYFPTHTRTPSFSTKISYTPLKHPRHGIRWLKVTHLVWKPQRKQNKVVSSPLYDVEIIPVVSLIYDVILRFDQDLEHGIQNLRELFLEDVRQEITLLFSPKHFLKGL